MWVSVCSLEKSKLLDGSGWNLAQRWSLRAGRFLGGGVDPIPPPPGMGSVKGVQGASGASAMCFGKNFIKQKLLGTPDLVGRSPFWAPCPSGALVTHYEWELTKQILEYMTLIVIWLDWTPSTLSPRVQGAQKGGLEPQPCILAPIWTPNPDLEGPGCASGAVVPLL